MDQRIDKGMNDCIDDCRIIVFARAPVPGATKTRLIPALGAEGAALLHRRLVRRMLAEAVASGLGPVDLYCTPDASHPFFAQCAGEFGVGLVMQSGADLGDRLCHAFDQSLAQARHVLVVGSDIPALTAQHLRLARAALDAKDAVYVPAEDGGYVLVGLKQPQPVLFQRIDWGGAQVMAQSRQRAAGAAVSLAELETLWDLDRPEDLERVAPGLLAGLTRQDGLPP
jgi:rSAM/selenodomain-associated transferase 1